MLNHDSRDVLVLAHERAATLLAETRAEQVRRAVKRRNLAASLRRVADRLDPAPLAHRLA